MTDMWELQPYTTVLRELSDEVLGDPERSLYKGQMRLLLLELPPKWRQTAVGLITNWSQEFTTPSGVRSFPPLEEDILRLARNTIFYHLSCRNDI